LDLHRVEERGATADDTEADLEPAAWVPGGDDLGAGRRTAAAFSTQSGSAISGWRRL